MGTVIPAINEAECLDAGNFLPVEASLKYGSFHFESEYGEPGAVVKCN